MKQQFFSTLKKELQRVDDAHTTKRNEKIIEEFTKDPSPQAKIGNSTYRIFNSNDYLGLRFNKEVHEGEIKATEKFGSGPGSVRFISGTLKIYIDLEKALATFHGKDDAMVFSSAFATNVAVISCLIKGQSKDSFVAGDTLVISDALNHRSIIEGIRVANLPSDNKKIYQHLDYDDLDHILNENKGKFTRALVITDGIFSMLGEHVDLKKIQEVAAKYDSEYNEGVITIVDDSHGVGAYGKTGRGCEEVCNAQADVLIGTLGKAFGADGGYVASHKIIIDYLRESAATYIYSNPISPSVAGAALASVNLLNSTKGNNLLNKSQDNISYFKKEVLQKGFSFSAESSHPIQAILIGDTAKTKQLTEALFKKNILVTMISYPVVPPGKDEIRVQINATHTKEDLDYFIEELTLAGKSLGLV